MAIKMRLHLLSACFYLLSLLLLSGKASGHIVEIFVINKCPFGVWPATAPNTGHPVLANGGFFLDTGRYCHIQAPGNWSGRIWARTGCDFPSNTWQPACQTGDCDGRLSCNGLIGSPPATLVEISLHTTENKPSYYDVSLVDGYNLPVSVTTRPTTSNSSIEGCLKDLNILCPTELQVLNQDNQVVACKSACLAYDLDNFCCRNEYGNPDKCKPSVYSKMFKDACPSYVSYAFDTPTPLVTCRLKELVITFCPSKCGTIMAS